MTAKQERQAEAFTVWKRHGDRAPAFVAEHIGALALAGDAEGVKRWKEIAAAMDELMHGERN